MAWNLDSDRPIYAQLLERIQLQIVSGTYGPVSYTHLTLPTKA